VNPIVGLLVRRAMLTSGIRETSERNDLGEWSVGQRRPHIGPRGQPRDTGEGDGLVGNEAAAKDDDDDDEDSTGKPCMLHGALPHRVQIEMRSGRTSRHC
jgi:hypothetical protein